MPERKPLDDRQLDAVLERLDKLVDEIHVLNRRLDHAEGFARLAHELRSLNESLQAIAYAALGQQGPQVRRRRAGGDGRPGEARTPSRSASQATPRAALGQQGPQVRHRRAG